MHVEKHCFFVCIYTYTYTPHIIYTHTYLLTCLLTYQLHTRTRMYMKTHRPKLFESSPTINRQALHDELWPWIPDRGLEGESLGMD